MDVKAKRAKDVRGLRAGPGKGRKVKGEISV